jgi:hypothetical protein
MFCWRLLDEKKIDRDTEWQKQCIQSLMLLMLLLQHGFNGGFEGGRCRMCGKFVGFFRFGSEVYVGNVVRVAVRRMLKHPPE